MGKECLVFGNRFAVYKKQVASFASQPLNRRIAMALLGAPEVAIAIAIDIAKTLIARSRVMLLEELLNATAIGSSQSAIALEWRSNTTKKTFLSARALPIEASGIGCNC